ncbi:MAG: TolB family protein [Ardenticatenaceae bacterium]
MNIKLLFSWLFIFLFGMTACGTTYFEATRPQTSAPDEGMSASATPAMGATQRRGTSPSLTPSEPPAKAFVPPSRNLLLPAPLYLLSGESGDQQIWRLESDSKTQWQLTHEESGVTDFDVSPTNGALVYTTGDGELVRSDPFGNDRVLLDRKTEADEIGLSMPITMPLTTPISINHPRWSPDGRQIAYSLIDLHLIDATEGQRQTLLTNNLALEATDSAYPTDLYRPESWSPDGTQLLVALDSLVVNPPVVEPLVVGASAPSGRENPLVVEPSSPSSPDRRVKEFVILNLSDNSLTEFGHLAPLACCDPSWSHDSDSVYFAYDGPTRLLLGLRQADTQNGQIISLLGENGQGWPFVAHPTLSPDGYLYAWRHPVADKKTPNALPTQPPMLQRVQINRTYENKAWQIVNRERHHPLETLWAPDFSGTIIRINHPPNNQNDHLRWLPAKNAPSQPLPLRGHHLHWGAESPLMVSAETND